MRNKTAKRAHMVKMIMPMPTARTDMTRMLRILRMCSGSIGSFTLDYANRIVPSQRQAVKSDTADGVRAHSHLDEDEQWEHQRSNDNQRNHSGRIPRVLLAACKQADPIELQNDAANIVPKVTPRMTSVVAPTMQRLPSTSMLRDRRGRSMFR